jgi:fructokinase
MAANMAEARTDAVYGALELGGSKALCALGSSREVLDETRIETTTPEATLAGIERFFAPHRARMRALGIASFGPLELDPNAREHGSMLNTPKRGWSGTPLHGRLQAALAKPVFIDTDVNAAALAEQALGSARGRDPCVYVTIGTGIGVGVRIAGAPLHGLLHPELGHLPAPAWDDFPGVCPFHGRCLEGVASAHALSVRSGRAPERLSDDDAVWALEARYLAHLLVACVLAYAPRAIVLGGGVSQRAGLIEQIRAHLLEALAGYIPRAELSPEGVARFVVPAHFGQRAGLVGAFLLAEEGARGRA